MTIDQVKQQLENGASLGEVSLSVLPAATRDTVRRCAVVPWFTAELYRQVLRTADGPQLAELSRQHLASPNLAPHSDRFRVQALLGEAAWHSWWTSDQQTPDSPTVPPALACLAEKLVAYYRTNGPPLEELRQLLLADPARAGTLFTELYRQCADRFDLAGCQDVIDVLAAPDRAPLLPVELAQLRNDHQLYLAARCLWAAEYHQTTRYLPRPELEEPLFDLLCGDPSRILQIYAQAGMGKTMQVRWFAARHCLVQEPPVPCARIDFDLVDPVVAVRHPWLLLLEFAEQLDSQIIGSPFHELLRTYGHYRPALDRMPAPRLPAWDPIASGLAAESSAAGELATIDTSLVATRFCDALDGAESITPVVLIMDTWEEAVLRSTADMRNLLDMLGLVHDRLPPVRLLLAGRYDLRCRLPGFSEHFPDAVPANVGPFEPAQARHYLSGVRGIQDARLVEAVVNSCEGLPFTLALFGDLLQEDHTLTAAQIADTHDPALLYCIVKILERIPDDRIRWALRYGVVPRRLTLHFLVEVLGPYLVRGIGGTGRDLDDPVQDDRPPRPVSIFNSAPEHAPAGAAELQELWHGLAEYADASSWVRLEQGTLVLHPRVREPLRQLLRPKRVFTALHERAREYYERLAEREPERWSLWTREALYHRFQVDGDAAVPAWRAALEYTHRLGRSDWSEDLARDLVALKEDDGAAPTVPGSLMAEARYQAHLELARCSADQARADLVSPDNQLWSMVESHLDAADRLLAHRPGGPTPATGHVILHANLALVRGAPQEARRRLAGPLPGMSPTEERDAALLRAEATAAETGSAESNAAATRDRQEALERSVGLGDDTGAALILLELLRDSIEADRPEDALARVTRERTAPLTPQLGRVARLGSAAALIRLGRPASGLAEVTGHWDTISLEGGARALLMLRRPADALDAVLGEATAELATGGGDGRLAAVCCQAFGDQLLVDEAMRLFAPLVATEATGVGPARVATALARLHLRSSGNLRATQEYLRAATAYHDPKTRHPLPMARMRGIDLLVATGDLSGAARMLQTTVAELEEDRASARQLVAATVTGLSIGRPETVRFALPVLLDRLAAIPDASARLAALGGLRRCRSFDGALPAELRRFQQLVLQPWEQADDDQLLPGDRAWQQLVAAEAYRLVDRPELARTCLDQAARALSADSPLIWWDWVRALDRLGPAEPGEPEPPADLLAGYADKPALCAGYLADLTRRRLDTDPPAVTRSRLDAAWRLLPRGRRPVLSCEPALHDLQSAVEQRDGNGAAAHEQSALAAAGWGELGDFLRRARSLVSLGTGDSRQVRPWWSPPRAQVTLVLGQDESGGLRIGTALGTKTAQHSKDWLGVGPTERQPADEDLVEQLQNDWLQWSSVAGVHLLEDILGDGPTPGSPAPPYDLCLRLDSEQLTAVPWELLRHGKHPVGLHPLIRHLYRGSDLTNTECAETLVLQRTLDLLGLLKGPIDGVLGPRTRRDLAAFMVRSGTTLLATVDRRTWRALREAARAVVRDRGPRRRPHVLVVQPGLARTLQSQRGMKGSRADIEAVYRRYGLRPTVLENPSTEWLIERAGQLVAADDAPDIVHLCAAMGARHGARFLDFYGRSAPVPVAGLHYVLQQLSPAAAPLVVLDIIASPSEYETIRQLLLRNQFATELMSLGPESVVLATGLAAPEAVEVQRQALAAGFAADCGAAEVCRRLRAQWSPSMSRAVRQAIPSLGTALFSSVSPDALMEPGLLRGSRRESA
ncbi:hypothetical protein [Kitasatospora cinereorecta]|uniref:Uncharacterized protein n=1 Tax=Kitasatospora cinereorecta TaxID=285560 RepID=A0ABW0VHY5_9ACTN